MSIEKQRGSSQENGKLLESLIKSYLFDIGKKNWLENDNFVFK